MTHHGRATRLDTRGSRLLSFEFLERRDLLAVLRLVSWNTANAPNTALDSNFTTILQAIGEETVQGTTKRLDILALQETDVIEFGSNSIGKITDILNNLYPAADYVSQYSTEDGGGDVTGFIFDTTTISLLGTPITVPGDLTHTTLRAQFRPNDTLGESDFYVYSIHLKSGDSGAEAAQRGAEAAVLHANANALGEGVQVLFVGDFNMKGSTEPAYANMTASGAGQVQDVANAPPGTWIDNLAYKSLHSQDPAGNLNDRFDIHFASGELFDNVGLEYVSNSFHVFGNNGTHTLGQSITTGTGASPTVLAALAAASDHLPVVADYEIIPSTPNVRITETSGGSKVVEGGLYDTYYVVLDTQPSADVTVTVTPDLELDVLGNATSNPRQLVFTPANWQTPQVVVVRAINDTDNEGNHTGSITHTSASSDPNYNLLTIDGVTATVVDNDMRVIVINEVDADTPNAPTNDNKEFIELYDGGVGNTSLTDYFVVLYKGETDAIYNTFDLTGMMTDANGFFVLGNSTVTGVGMTFNINHLENGPDAVALYFASVTPANLRDAVVYSNFATDDADLRALLTPGQPLAREDQNGNETVHSVARVLDHGTPLQTTTYVAQLPTPNALNVPGRGVLMVQNGTRLDLTESGVTDSYQLALLSIPTADVQITVDPDAQTNLGAGAGVAIVLTFTPANALLPQTVTVTAVDDALAEGVHSSFITHAATSADAGYNGLAINSVSASILDNDFAVPPVIVITEIMYNPDTSESGQLPEWIEVVNAGSMAVDMGGWKFDDEDAGSWGTIPAGTILYPGQTAVFFNSGFTTATVFRNEWTVPSSALVVGVSWGNLLNNPNPSADPPDEVLQLFNNLGVSIDLVHFDNANPWPPISATSPTADGPSIYLKGLTFDNNNGLNWALSVVGAAHAVSPTGPTFSTLDIGSPGRFFLPGDYNLNGEVDAADFVLWRKTLNSSVPAGTGADGDGNGTVQQADYSFWRANFGNFGAYYDGGESAAGAGIVATSSALSSSVEESPSQPVVSTPEAASATVLAESVAVVAEVGGSVGDAVVIDARPFIPTYALAAATKPVPRSGAIARVTTSVELLLAVDRSFALTGSDRDADALFFSSANDDATGAGADEFFASLEEWEADLLALGR